MGLHFIAVAAEGTVAGTFLEMVVEGDPIIVGREEQADLVLPDISVSRRHLAIRSTGDGWTVEDLGSRLGTRLNGQCLPAAQAVPLREGDEIQAGAFRLMFAGRQNAQPTQDTRAIARRLVSQLVGGSSGSGQPPYLRVENGPAAGTRHLLPVGSKLCLGRGRECELVADDARISRVHAVVHNQGGQVWFWDADSTNGSYLDQIRVKEPVMLRDGSRIQIGRVCLALVDPEQRRLDWMAVLNTAEEPTCPSILPGAMALLLGALGFLAAVLW